MARIAYLKGICEKCKKPMFRKVRIYEVIGNIYLNPELLEQS